MIGSLLCYALYPISRYLALRPPEASQPEVPPAVVDGTAVWDGGTLTTRRSSHSQTTPVDQGLSGTEGETKERMKEPRKEEDVKRPETDVASEASELQPTAVEKEAGMRLGLQVEDPKQEDHCAAFSMKAQSSSDGFILPNEDLNPERDLKAQFECLQMEDGTPENTFLTQTNTNTSSLEEFAALQRESVEELVAPAEVTECWDEYVVSSAAEGADVAFHSLKLSGEFDSQPSWSFPAEAGEVQSSLWEYPGMSYYPPSAWPTVPFEVTWRVWEESEEAAEPIPFTKASMDFTVMSYNVLAEDLLEANQELYTHCPLEVLDWSYRSRLLLDEIAKWAPDILCLQEVQENHYHEQLYPALSQMGYTCVYKRRTGTKTDGCATCYQSSCFSEMSVTPLEFFRPETELLDRHNVGIVALLRPVFTRGSDVKAWGPPLCVANTHLLFNPRRGDVKLAQLAVMLAEVNAAVASCKAEGERCNVVLCGDFNSVPHSPLYQLIAAGELYFHGLPAWAISGQEDLSHKPYCHKLFAPLWPSCLEVTDNCQYTVVKETTQSQPQKQPGKYSHDFLLQLRFCPDSCVRPQDLELIPGVTDNTPDASRGNPQPGQRFRHSLRHILDLESVYKHTLPGSGSPEVTTLHSEMGATVDYIFYTPRRTVTCEAGGDFVREGLKLIGSLSLLSEDVLWSMGGLPNDIFPSDHLSLVAKFQLELNAA